MSIRVIHWNEASLDDVLLFHHLPKTAGTAVSSALEGLYGAEYYKWFHGPAGALKTLADGHSLRALGGHFHLSHPTVNRIDVRVIMITLLRDPIDRVISNFYYLRANEKHHLYELANAYSLEEALRKGLSKKLQIDNEIVRMLSTVDPKDSLGAAFRSAKETVKSYTFFGLQKQTRMLELLIKRVFNIEEFKIPVMITNTGRPKKTEVDPDLIALIKKYNQYDVELYDFAEEIYNNKLEKEWRLKH